jgi:hypothetical protein
MNPYLCTAPHRALLSVIHSTASRGSLSGFVDFLEHAHAITKPPVTCALALLLHHTVPALDWSRSTADRWGRRRTAGPASLSSSCLRACYSLRPARVLQRREIGVGSTGEVQSI